MVPIQKRCLLKKRLLIIVDSVNGGFRYPVVGHMVPIPTNLRDYKDEENVINWDSFGNIDKVYFFK